MSIYCGFVPFIDEWAWWANEGALGNRDCSCSRCGREFYEAGMDEASELCHECTRQVERMNVVIVDECENWSEERKQIEAWLYLRGL